MELPLTPAQARFRDEFRAWLAGHPPPRHLPAVEREAFAVRRQWQTELASGGYVGIDWPPEFGGRGLGPAERIIVERELGRAGAPVIAGLIGVSNIAPAVIRFGTDDQRARHLAPLRTAGEIWCQGMSEPGAGSDLGALATRAVLDGDEWVVTGQKVWCSNAHESDWCQLYARSGTGDSKYAGITCLLVDMRSPGIDVRRIPVMTGQADFCEVFFDGVRVPRGNVLGAVGEGWAVAMDTLAHERVAALSLEVTLGRMVDELLALARSSPDGALRRQQVAGAYAQSQILHALGLRVLSRIDEGEGAALGTVVKLFASELTRGVAELAVDVLGPDAMLTGPWQHRFLDTRSITIAGGTAEVLRNVVAERVLGLPRG